MAGKNQQEEIDPQRQYIIERDGMRYAGNHLLVDMLGARNIDNLEVIQRALLDAIKASDATLVDLVAHQFDPNGGITALAILAQSHMVIHSWPEYGIVAVDIFMCGESDPHRAIPVLEAAFQPETIEVTEQKRGRLSEGTVS